MFARHFILAWLTLVAALAMSVPLALSDTGTPDLSTLDPCHAVNESAPVSPGPCDTASTPEAKPPTSLWTQVAGAVYPGATASSGYHQADSPTRPTDDLFAIGFRNPSLGFAGGAACDSPDGDPATCARHPVVYRYSDTDGHGPQWRLDSDFPGAGRGFVGAIAYVPHSDKFVAVGGTGCYPRREVSCTDGTGPAGDDAGDPIAGKARAWVFDGTGWDEITNELPPAMRGMSALAFTTAANQYGDDELGVAGALGQLLVWKNGEFAAAPIDAGSSVLEAPPSSGPSTDDATPQSFRFRVRDIEAPTGPRPLTAGRFIAVTAGCCSDAPVDPSSPAAADIPWLLLSDDIDHWTIHRPPSRSGTLLSQDPRLVSAYSVAPHIGVGGETGTTGAYLLNADGPPAAAEPQSSFPSGGNDALVGGMRLVAGDGLVAAGSGGQGFDWYVGVDRNNGHGIVYGIGQDLSRPNGGICAGTATGLGQGFDLPSCSTGDPTSGQQPSVDVQKEQTAAASYRLLDLGTYALNTFRVSNGETGGIGFAVGDRGAIVQLGAPAPSAGSEPPPAHVGASQAAAFTNTGPYDAFRPLVSGLQSGGVPALAGRPLERLTVPGPVPAGSPDPASPPFGDVASVVMSRDGAEGWAVGGTNGLALYHYDGARWTQCNPQAAPPDPHCSGLKDLSTRKLKLSAATRVPLENGGDPSKADDFEVVAVGDYQLNPGIRRQVVVRYVNGRWQPEDPAAAARIATGDNESGNEYPTVLDSVAFAAPDDGWAVGVNAGANQTPAGIYHFDGRRWIDCWRPHADPDVSKCDDDAASPRLPEIYPDSPAGQDVLRVLAVGRRVYLSGARVGHGEVGGEGVTEEYPLILCHDPGKKWAAQGCGYDPGLDQAPSSAASAANPQAPQGEVTSLAVSQTGPQTYQGWAIGYYAAGAVPKTHIHLGAAGAPSPPKAFADARLMRLDPGAGSWTQWKADDAASDYLAGLGGTGATNPTVAAGLRNSPFGSAVMASAASPVLGYDDAAKRWHVLETPVSPTAFEPELSAGVEALAPDPSGGFWIAAGKRDANGGPPPWFYHYANRAPKPVFTDAPQPLERPITALAGAPDGTVWVATDSDLLARYGRLTGWDTQHIPGWDPGRLVTAASPVNAIALGPDGSGLAVGAGGRIANISAAGIQLDRAAGASVCSLPPAAPVCGTGRTLRAAAVASDGSAMVGGDALTLLWRRGGGEFQAISKPAAAAATRIVGIAMPTAGQAWLALSTGQVFAGTLSGGDWSWQLENTDKNGDLLSNNSLAKAIPLRAIAVDPSGHGLAVGDSGLVLERDPSGGDHPWRRLDTGFADNLTSVTLPTGGGAGALIGGDNGLVLTLADGRFAIAHTPDRFGAEGKPVVGVALLPGLAAGQTEAWAALSDPTSGNALLHYASAGDDPLLDPGARAQPLPDSPDPREGELSLAAFGQSDCHLSTSSACDALSGLALANDIGARRTALAIADASKRPGGPSFALFTGDVNDAAGRLVETQAQTAGARTMAPNVSNWAQLVAARLTNSGVPLFGAPGYQDVSSDYVCNPVTESCVFQKQVSGQGACAASQCVAPAGSAQTNLLWRSALAAAPAPWGMGGAAHSGALSFEPVGDATGDARSPVPGARTHYALDVTNGSRKVTRIVVVDNSQRSLSASDPAQDPVTPGGQQAWLQSMLCQGGSGCTRAAGESAIVLANTPSYSYGAGAGTGTATDASTFEATLLQNHADLLVTGRIGWNALYYTLQAGLHYPCPGQAYPSAPPSDLPTCGVGSSGSTDSATEEVQSALSPAQQLSNTLQTLGAPAPPVDPTGTALSAAGVGLLPSVVASGAGGKLAQSDGEGEWHGYTIVRLDRTADPNKTIVEQRPVFDWIGLSAVERTLHPGQHVTLRGIGREPLSVDEPAHVDKINSPAITHRYDLIEADPQHPWLPKVDEAAKDTETHGYVPLDPSVATVDQQSGKVTTGRGNHPRVYAIALLSVGDKAASWPMVFEPKKSYAPPRPRIITPPAVPPIRVLAFSAQGLQAPPSAPPPQTPPPISTNLQLPAPPTLPVFPTATATPVAPPAPPAPPPPPSGQQAPPLDLSLNLTGIAVPPTPGVTAQPTPPVQPAPPSGARREAKQRQAATAKSEEGTNESAREDAATGEGQGQGQQNAFTAITRREQPSAWVTGLEWGGGIGLMALVLALGFVTVRPTPRRGRPATATLEQRRRPYG